MKWNATRVLASLALTSLLLVSACQGVDDDDADDDDLADDDSGVDDDDDTGDDDTGDDDSADDDSADDDSTPTDDVYIWPSLDFGEVELGCDAVLEVQVINQGQERVTVEAASIDPTDAGFTVEPPAEWPIAIFPGFDLELEIRFTPGAQGDREATLVVLTDHEELPELHASAEGAGVSAGEQTDEFVQEVEDRVDVLWVVDNSCSMAEEQANLAANAATFLGLLDDDGLDYQIGVVTTDDPTLQGAVPIVTPSTPDAADAFAAAVQLGTNGAWTEQPLLQGYDALTAPMTDPGWPNEGMLRAGAGLAVVLVTDEEDQSGGAAVDWAAQFQALQPDPSLVAISGIYGLAAGCSSPDGIADPSPRIEEVVALTGGVEVSICDQDWSPVLANAPSLVSGPGLRFPLSESPMPETIAVTVDTTPVTQGWSFDEVDVSVVFEADAAPAEGADVAITYDVVGDCGGAAAATSRGR